MQSTLMGLPVEMWAMLCFVVAGAYTIYWPRPPRTGERTAWQQFVLRWFHALTWAWIGLAALAMKYIGVTVAQTFGVLGLVTYLVFMIVFVREKMRYPQG